MCCTNLLWFINVNEQRENIKQEKWASPILLKEVETDQAREETAEIININHDSESKFQKSDEHETFELKGKFSKVLPKELQEKYEAMSVAQDTLRPVKKTQARKSSSCCFSIIKG
ncbi:hypothetical protein TNCV_1865851 [Trichonephila clavipes]|nr:hypothetical protein TNCV_1865851 [Trichonephila clavipes]